MRTCAQVLQVLEALLKQLDVLNGPAHATLPYASPAGQFLDALGDAGARKLVPGEVLMLPLPRTPAPINVSPPRRIGPDFQSAGQAPLRRYPPPGLCTLPLDAPPLYTPFLGSPQALSRVWSTGAQAPGEGLIIRGCIMWAQMRGRVLGNCLLADAC